MSWVRFAGELPTLPEFAERAQRWHDALDLDEAAELVREGRGVELRTRLRERLLGEVRARDRPVVLVGAGPGDPELITIKGARSLAAADVVVYDRLVAPVLLGLVPPDAERIYVGKEPGRAAVPQREIERLLVDRALDGSTVVRRRAETRSSSVAGVRRWRRARRRASSVRLCRRIGRRRGPHRGGHPGYASRGCSILRRRHRIDRAR